MINNEENIFVCPSTVSFAAGEKTAKLTVETPSAAEGITYNLQLALSGKMSATILPDTMKYQ